MPYGRILQKVQKKCLQIHKVPKKSSEFLDDFFVCFEVLNIKQRNQQVVGGISFYQPGA